LSAELAQGFIFEVVDGDVVVAEKLHRDVEECPRTLGAKGYHGHLNMACGAEVGVSAAHAADEALGLQFVVAAGKDAVLPVKYKLYVAEGYDTFGYTAACIQHPVIQDVGGEGRGGGIGSEAVHNTKLRNKINRTKVRGVI